MSAYLGKRIAEVTSRRIVKALWIHNSKIDAGFVANVSAKFAAAVRAIYCLQARHVIHLIAADVGRISIDIVVVSILTADDRIVIMILHLQRTMVVLTNNAVGGIAIRKVLFKECYHPQCSVHCSGVGVEYLLQFV